MNTFMCVLQLEVVVTTLDSLKIENNVFQTLVCSVDKMLKLMRHKYSSKQAKLLWTNASSHFCALGTATQVLK